MSNVMNLPFGARMVGIQYEMEPKADRNYTPPDVTAFLQSHGWGQQNNGAWMPPPAYSSRLIYGDYPWHEAISYEIFRGFTLHEYDAK